MFPIVHWVLPPQSIPENDQCLRWKYIQKCVHGRKQNTMAQNYLVDDTKHTTQISKREQQQVNQIPIITTKAMTTLDKRMTLWIQTTNWNGEKYNAIVLAGACGKYSESDVYINIRSIYGVMELAGAAECEIARSLLTEAILYFCKSLVDPLTNNHFLDATIRDENEERDVAAPSTTAMKTEKDNLSQTISAEGEKLIAIREAIEQFRGNDYVPVPKALEWKGRVLLTIRMVSFTDSTDGVDNINPAPDPILLLVKAMSNWFKRNDLFVLPYFDDDSNTTADDDDDSSTTVSSLNELIAANKQLNGSWDNKTLSFFDGIPKDMSDIDDLYETDMGEYSQDDS